MALTLALNDVIRMQYICAAFEQTSVNTVYYLVTGVGSPAAVLDDAVENFGVMVSALVKPLIENSASYSESIGQVIRPLPLMSRVIDNIDAGAGTGGAIGQGRQVAGLISFHTDQAGPGYRGRNFLPFPSVAACQLYGLPTAAYVTAAQALADGLRNFTGVSLSGRTATVAQCLYKRAGAVATVVVKSVAQGAFATQKRRGSYGRPNNVPR